MDITTDTKSLVNEFSEKYLTLALRKKDIDLDIKRLKEDYNEQGVATNVVVKAINNLKKKKKLDDSEVYEIEQLESWLSENRNIDDKLTELLAK